MTYGLEGGDLAFTARNVVHDEASSGLTSVLVVEEIPGSISAQCMADY